MGGQRGNYGSKPVFPVLIMWIFPEIIPDYFWSGAESKLHRQTPSVPAVSGYPGCTLPTDTLISDGTKHASDTMTEEFSDIPVFMEQMA